MLFFNRKEVLGLVVQIAFLKNWRLTVSWRSQVVDMVRYHQQRGCCVSTPVR